MNIKVTDNNYFREYTAETEINALKITSPLIDLLPYYNYKKYTSPLSLNGTYIDCYGYYHFDFTNGLPYTTNRALIAIDNIQNITDIKNGTYTTGVFVSNIRGNYTINNIPCYRDYKEIGKDNVLSQNIGSINLSNNDVKYVFSFNVDEQQLTTRLRFGCDFLNWSAPERDLAFDIMFLGLYQGIVQVDRPSDNIGEVPSIVMENTKSRVGAYQISSNIQRHFNQIERHISSYDNQLKINFR